MILVTGATGLVGSHVCRLLISSEISFRALRRPGADTSLCDGLTIDWVEGDVLDLLTIYRVVEGIETVIHCAAMVSFDEADNQQMMSVNVKGTRNLVNACLQHGVSEFIHVSSVAALGRAKSDTVINENTQWVESPMNSTYAKSKYLSEMEVWRGQSEGLNIAIVNPSIVIGAADGKRSSSKLLQYVWEEHKFYVDRHINFVDVRDVARAILDIYTKSTWGERYILNLGHMKYQKLFEIVAEHFKKKPPKIKVRIPWLKTGVLLSRLLSFFTGTPPVVSNEMLKSMKGDFYYSNKKIVKDMQFEFTDEYITLQWACSEFMKIKSPN